MQHDDPLTAHPDLVALGSTSNLPPPPPRRRARWLLVGIGAIAVVVFAFATWWILDSTVPSDDYDDVVAELDATRSDLAAARRGADRAQAALSDQIDELNESNNDLRDANEGLRDANEGLRRELADDTDRISALAGANSELRANLEGATVAADAIAYAQLNLDPEWFAELRRMGADATMFDELLAQLGHDETMDSWLESGDAWFHANAAVFATDDSTLIDAWVAWNEAELGSVDEAVAWSAFGIRLTALLQENLMDAAPRTSEAVQTARADRN